MYYYFAIFYHLLHYNSYIQDKLCIKPSFFFPKIKTLSHFTNSNTLTNELNMLKPLQKKP